MAVSSQLPVTSGRTNWLIAAALFLFGVVLYAPSLWFGFVLYDDGTVLLTHPQLYDEHSLLASLYQIFYVYFPREEPLLVRDLSWAVDSRLFGFNNPFGYHLGNVILNAGNAVLLFFFLLEATRRKWLAALSAMVWSTLAIHVEPVCWIMGRKDLLATFFSLAMLLLEASAMHAADERRSRTLRLLALLCYPLAVLSKFSAIALAGVVALFRLLSPYLDGSVATGEPLRARVAARVLAKFWPHLLIAALLYVWYSRVLHQFGITDRRGPSPLSREHLTLLAQLTPLVFGSYLRNLVATSQHSIFYDWPNAAIALTGGQQLLSVLIAVALLAVGIHLGRRRKDLFFFFSVFFVLMVTYLNIVYIGIWVADRYVYLSSFCVVVIVLRAGQDLIERLRGSLRRWAGVLALVLVALFAGDGIAASIRHQRAFRDQLSLWQWETTRSHPSMRALSGRALSLIVAADAAHDPKERRRLAIEAQHALKAAETHFAAVRWRRADHYIIDAFASRLDLIEYRGRLAAILGKPLEEQLKYYRQAYAASGRHDAARLAAQKLFHLALRQGDESLARESLRYYTAYIKGALRDPVRISNLFITLEGYRRSFPALTPEVAAIIKRYLHDVR